MGDVAAIPEIIAVEPGSDVGRHVHWWPGPEQPPAGIPSRCGGSTGRVLATPGTQAMPTHATAPLERRRAAAPGRIAAPLWILAVLATAFFLRETREVFVPVALALLASFAAYPLVRRIDGLGVPRPVSAALVVGGIVGILGWGGWTLKDDFAAGARDLPQQIRQIRTQVQSGANGGIVSRLREAARELQDAAEFTGTSAAGASFVPPGAAAGGNGATSSAAPIAGYLWQESFSVLSLAGQSTVFVFLLFFFLVGADRWRARLVTLSGDVLSSRRTGAEVLDEINRQIQRFLLVQVATAVIVGVATWVVLLRFGAPTPALWAVAAGLLNWVPYFGPVIVSVGLAIVGFVAGGLEMAGQLAGAALVITTLEGWLLTPLLLGRAARMNTIAILLGLLFWSWVWGVWGTILAVPLMSMIKAVSDQIEPLHWVSTVLADEPESAVSATRRG
jgi:predicted PurR-regulated permease PerM